jgi:hypothetical protein
MSDTIARRNPRPFTPGKLPEISEADRKRPIWEVFEELAKQIPEEELDKIPHDGAELHDHYLSHTPRTTPPEA